MLYLYCMLINANLNLPLHPGMCLKGIMSCPGGGLCSLSAFLVTIVITTFFTKYITLLLF